MGIMSRRRQAREYEMRMIGDAAHPVQASAPVVEAAPVAEPEMEAMSSPGEEQPVPEAEPAPKVRSRRAKNGAQ